MAEQFANGASTTLAAAATAVAGTITVTDASTFPAAAPFRIRIDDEILIVTAMGGTGNTTWTVTRAVEEWAGAATAAAHSIGADVRHVWTAGAADLMLQDDEPIHLDGISAADPIFISGRQAGDAYDRAALSVGSRLEFGGGSSPMDWRLRRTSAGLALIDSDDLDQNVRLWLQGATGRVAEFAIRDQGDSVPRLALRGDSISTQIELGAGGASARDIILSRDGAGLLKMTAAGPPHFQIQSAGLDDALLTLLSGSLGGALQLVAEASGPMILFGAGGGFDTDLYRSAGNALRTSGSFRAVTLQADDIYLGASYPNPESTLVGGGHMELRSVNPYIDFANDAAADFDVRIIYQPSLSDTLQVLGKDFWVRTNVLIGPNTGAGRMRLSGAAGVGADSLGITNESGAVAKDIYVGGVYIGENFSEQAPPSYGIAFGGDVTFYRSAANVLRVGAGDRLDNDGVGAHIIKTTAQTIASGGSQPLGATFTATPWIGMYYDYNAYGGGEFRVHLAGLYVIYVNVTWQANATGRRGVGIAMGNSGTPTAVPSDLWDVRAPSPTGDTNITLTAIRYLNAFDTFRPYVVQGSGVNLNVTYAAMGAVRIAAA